ncbi:MAG: glycosyltransferase family 1 protein [Cyanobacteria bacterium J06592_8]
MGQFNPLARTGVARVIENIAYGLASSEECDLFFFESLSFDILNACLSYLRSNSNLLGIPLSHSSQKLNFYNQLIQLRKSLEHYQGEDLQSVRLNQNLQEMIELVNQSHRESFNHFSRDIDILHATYYPIPSLVESCKTVCKILNVFDLIPIIFPHFFGLNSSEEHIIYKSLKSLEINRDWAICISHSTKNDLCEYLEMDEDRVFVAHLAADPNIFYPYINSNEATSIRNQYGITDSPYILSLSTLEPRKNIDHLIRCFTQVIQEQNIKDLNLVLVGSQGWNYDVILQEISSQQMLRDRIIVTGRVADQDLAAIYSGAVAFVYPSLYEGFGLPPLEAMQCGVPVITSNTSSLPEVVGDAGILLNPTDADMLCHSIFKVYDQSSLRDKMSSKSLEQAQKFSWKLSVDSVLSAYRTALKYK